MSTWTVPGTIVRVIDADTFAIDLDLGWRVFRNEEHLRIAGIDAPERFTRSGREAKAWAEDLLPAGTVVSVTSEAKPSFERTVGSVSYMNDAAVPCDYAAQAVREGHAVWWTPERNP